MAEQNEMKISEHEIPMTPYELMIKANHYLIKGGMLTDAQKQNIVRQLMAARSTQDQARRFYAGVKFPDNIDPDGRQMYPFFFIPPYNDGKKYKTIFNQTPKTHIMSANMYELEILRLHEDKDLFEQTIINTFEFYKIEYGIIEKDYYVTIVLKELVKKIPNLTFKGGKSPIMML